MATIAIADTSPTSTTPRRAYRKADLPKHSNGNDKLGKCTIFNRAVGTTCDNRCPYHPASVSRVKVPKQAKCYALSTEQRFPAARSAGESNACVSPDKLSALFGYAHSRGDAIRLHERGDVADGGQGIDFDYLESVLYALDQNPDAVMWGFTHSIDPAVAAINDRPNASLYASVHNAEDIVDARKAGFSLVAIVIENRAAVAKTHLKSLDVYDGGAWIELPDGSGDKALVCPAQRCDKITCCGGRTKKYDKTHACGHCVYGRGNVAFLTH